MGDSLNRNMWESLVCILRHSVVNKSRVHEASGRRDFKTSGYYSFIYEASSILLNLEKNLGIMYFKCHLQKLIFCENPLSFCLILKRT